MKYFIYRNIKLFFKEKVTVFFSFLSPIIFLFLYFVVFRSGQTQTVSNDLSDTLVLVANVILVIFNVSIGGCSRMIDDRLTEARKDFMVTPLTNTQLVLATIISSALISQLFGIVFLFLTQLYLLVMGYTLLSLVATFKLLGLIIVSSVFFSLLLFVLMSYLKTRGAYAGFSSVTGSSIGFLTGLFVPMGILSETMRKVAVIFAPTHIVALGKYIVFADKSANLLSDLSDAQLQELKRFFGAELYFGDRYISMGQSAIYLAITALVFFLWGSRRIRK